MAPKRSNMFISFGFIIVFAVIKHGLTFNLPALYQITEPVDHGECPVWDPRTGLLYYVDIHSGRVFSYDYATNKTEFIKLHGDVAPVLPSKDPRKLIVGLNRSVVSVEWDGRGAWGSQRTLTTVQEQQPDSITNDGKVDKEGRIWIGTKGFETRWGKLTPNGGILFRVTKEDIKNPQTVISPVNISNGLAWNKANNKFYYIDTPSQEVAEYDYDNDKGEITNRRVAFSLKKNGWNHYPDGMTIDKDDNLWIALYGGGSIIKVNPTTGELLQRVAVPAEAVTSAAWGGPQLDILFVTTSRYSLDDEQRLRQPAAGSVFAITNLGTSGLPVFYADIGDTV